MVEREREREEERKGKGTGERGGGPTLNVLMRKGFALDKKQHWRKSN